MIYVGTTRRVGEGGYTIEIKPYIPPPNQWTYIISDPTGALNGAGFGFRSLEDAEADAERAIHERLHIKGGS